MKKDNNTDGRIVSHELFLNPVKASDVFKIYNGKCYIGDKEITDVELWNLSIDCDFFIKTRLFSLFQETLRNQAYTKVFCRIDARDEKGDKLDQLEEIKGGKWMLYALDEIVRIITLIQKAAEKLPNGGNKK